MSDADTRAPSKKRTASTKKEPKAAAAAASKKLKLADGVAAASAVQAGAGDKPSLHVQIDHCKS